MNQEIMQFQMYQNQLKQLEEYSNELQNHKKNIENAQDTLKEIKNSEKGAKILAPIANGIFIEVILENNQEIINQAGSNTAVRKSIDETSQMLDKEHDAIKNHEQEIESQKKELAQIISFMHQKIAKAQKE
jgi:prefoldin alpha subunit